MGPALIKERVPDAPTMMTRDALETARAFRTPPPCPSPSRDGPLSPRVAMIFGEGSARRGCPAGYVCSTPGKVQRRLPSPLVHVTHSFTLSRMAARSCSGRILGWPPLGLAVRHGRLPQPQGL